MVNNSFGSNFSFTFPGATAGLGSGLGVKFGFA